MTKDYLNSLFRYEDGKLYWKDTTIRGPGRPRSKGAIGYVGSKGYLQHSVPGYGTREVAHTIWVMHNGPVPKGYELDHNDRVRTNNHIDNLRLATVSEQKCNRARVHRAGVPPKYPRNVCRSGKRYFAKVYMNKKARCGPMRDTPEEASRDAVALRIMYHGEFACHSN